MNNIQSIYSGINNSKHMMSANIRAHLRAHLEYTRWQRVYHHWSALISASISAPLINCVLHCSFVRVAYLSFFLRIVTSRLVSVFAYHHSSCICARLVSVFAFYFSCNFETRRK